MIMFQESDLLSDLVSTLRVPGAGKSTLAYPLTELINEKLGASAIAQHVDREKGLVASSSSRSDRIAISVSLDGWHTSRADLDKMPVSKIDTLRSALAQFTTKPSHLGSG